MLLETLSTNEMISTLFAIAFLLSGAFVFGKLFERLKMPKVVGEITGGMIFGSSCIHYFFPEIIESIFIAYDEEGKILNIFYQLGLIFLMYSSGFNTKIELNKKNSKLLSFLFIGATIIPMAACVIFINPFMNYFIGTAQNKPAFYIVFMISVAITSIPVISKIFFDIGIINTKFSNIILTTSTIQDLCLWIMLNTAVHMAYAQQFEALNTILISVVTIALLLGTKILADKLSGFKINVNKNNFFSISFIFLFVIIGLLSLLGINTMYSAFIAGYITKSISEGNKDLAEKMSSIADFSFSFFVPIYFALVGIQLNVIHNFSFVRFLLYFICAFTLEFVGCAIMLLFTDIKRKSIWNFGITMNARGGPGIVLATVAYSYNIINIEFFTVLILTTMLSSVIAGFWLRHQKKLDHDIFNNI